MHLILVKEYRLDKQQAAKERCRESENLLVERNGCGESEATVTVTVTGKKVLR